MSKQIGPLPYWAMLAYLWMAYLLSLRSVCLGLDNVPFGYATFFSCEEVVDAIWIPAYQTVFLMGGYYTFRAVLRNFGGRKILPRNRRVKVKQAAELIVLAQFIIVVFFLIKLASADTSNYGGWRTLSSKSSQMLLIMSSSLSFVSIKNNKYIALSIFASLYLAMIFAYTDASRSSLIPLGALCAAFIYCRRWFASALALAAFTLIFSYVMAARYYYARGFTPSLETVSIVIDSGLHFDMSYLFSFSFLHLLYATYSTRGSFDTTDFLYSVIPLPSSFMPFSVDVSSWMIDASRSHGGMGQALIVGIFSFALLNAAFGVLCASISRLPRGSLSYIALGMALFTFFAAFQYNLRGVQWIYYLTWVIILFAQSGRHSERHLPSEEK